MAARIKKDDQVIVISGKDRGKTGKVIRIDPRKDKVFVEGLNMIKRHTKPQQLRDTSRQQEAAGGVIEKEGPIHLSNVMLLDPSDMKPTRVGFEGGKRIGRRTGKAID